MCALAVGVCPLLARACACERLARLEKHAVCVDCAFGEKHAVCADCASGEKHAVCVDCALEDCPAANKYCMQSVNID